MESSRKPGVIIISNVPLQTFLQYQKGTRTSYIYSNKQTPTLKDIVIIELDHKTPKPPPVTTLTTTINNIIYLNTITSNQRLFLLSLNPIK